MRSCLLSFTLCLAAISGLSAQTTLHIDPDYAGGASDGSIDHPYTNWKAVLPISEGNTYLQKRGTVCTVDYTIPLKPDVTIGAYGEGYRPVIRNTVELPGNIGIFYAYNRNTDDPDYREIYRNITIRNFVIEGNDVTTNLLFEGNVEDVLVENCELVGGVWGIRVLTWGGSEDLETKLANRSVRILNNEIHGCGEDGIFVGYTYQSLEIGYNSIYDINRKYFGDFGGNGNSQSDAPGDPVQVTASYCNPWIHHNLLDKSSTEYKFALILASDGNTDLNPVQTTVEYNVMIGQGRNTAAVFYLDGIHDAVVRGNVMSNGPQAIYQKSTSGSLRAYNNIFYNVNFAVTNESSSGVEFYNNTLIDCGGVLQADFIDPLFVQNNLLYTPDTDSLTDWLVRYGGSATPSSSEFVSNHNLIYPEHPTMWIFGGDSYNTLADWQALGYGTGTVIADPLFVNAADWDYRLQSGSPAIDAGIEITDVTPDGDPTPDIGADMELLYATGIGPNAHMALVKDLAIPSTYGPYSVVDESYIDTGDWMGIFKSIKTAPFLWSETMGSFWYIEEAALAEDEPGAWVYIEPL